MDSERQIILHLHAMYYQGGAGCALFQTSTALILLDPFETAALPSDVHLLSLLPRQEGDSKGVLRLQNL
jgi:hypothetical protein